MTTIELLEDKIGQLEKRIVLLESSAPKTMEEYMKMLSYKHITSKVLAVSNGKIIHHLDKEDRFPYPCNDTDIFNSVKRIGSLLYIDQDIVINTLFPLEIHSDRNDSWIELVNEEKVYISNQAAQNIRDKELV